MGRRYEPQRYHEAGGRAAGREEYYRGFVILRDVHRRKVWYSITTVRDAEDARYQIDDPVTRRAIPFKNAEDAREFIDNAVKAGVDLNTWTSRKEGT